MSKAALVGVVAAASIAAIAVAVAAQSQQRADSVVSDQDLEALGRMLSSENPTGSVRLWVEQCWTQLRARRRGQSIYARITAGQGWGPQDSKRPVSTENPATGLALMVARLVLLGHELSNLPARKFFEPAQQDKAYTVATKARAKIASGLPITPQERRLLGYRSSADDVRRRWAADGSKFLAVIDGVEFWT